MKNDEIEYYIYLYFYKLQNKLNLLETRSELLKLNLHEDEANTDKPLKEFLKKFILSNNKEIQKSIVNKSLNISDLDSTYSFQNNIRISNILLPDEIPTRIINKLKDQNRVYTKPDLLIQLIDDNDKNYYIPLELKTTKTDVIPGSGVQQIDDDQWVIFIKISKSKSANEVKTIIGKYIWAINEKMQFPDRSPRPSISFKVISNWVASNIQDDDKILSIKSHPELIDKKKRVIYDWHSILVDRWLSEIQKPKQSKGWFNSVIREYTKKLLEFYKASSKDEKEKLLKNLNKKR